MVFPTGKASGNLPYCEHPVPGPHVGEHDPHLRGPIPSRLRRLCAHRFGPQSPGSPVQMTVDDFKLHVRRATPDDITAILDFVDETYGDGAPFKNRARHRWQYEESPFTPEDETDPTIWLALDGATVVGTIAVQDGAIRLDGLTIPAGWIVDVMVHPRYRGRQLSHLIHDAIMQERPVLVTLTMAAATRRVAERAGCLTLGPTRQFIRPHRLRARTVARYLVYKSRYGTRWRKLLLRGFNLTQVGPWIVAGLGRFAGWTRRRNPSIPFLKGFEVQEVERFPDTVDTLWEKISAKLGPVFDRSTRFLNWRFVECPGLAYRRFLLYREGMLVGYLVTRVAQEMELPAGIVVDILASPDDDAALDALLDLAARTLADETEYLEAAASHPAWQVALRRAGYIATRTMYPTVVCTDTQLRKRLASALNDWHFTKADHDWDQVHPV